MEGLARVNLPASDTGGVKGLCLEPRDLAIAKYAARRDKDRVFTGELVQHGLVGRETLLALVELTPVTPEGGNVCERTSRPTSHPPHPEEHRAAMRLEGWSAHLVCPPFETRSCGPLLR